MAYEAMKKKCMCRWHAVCAACLLKLKLKLK
jgi:hypothetical protein